MAEERDESGYQNGWILGKLPKGGGGGHFQSISLCSRFWNLKQGFLSMKLIQKSHFRVQGMFFQQGHQELSGESDENNPLKPNQSEPSIYIMIEICYFSLDQWEIRIHLLWGKFFNIPHHCDPHLNQTKFNDLLPLTIHGVFDSSLVLWQKISHLIWQNW